MRDEEANRIAKCKRVCKSVAIGLMPLRSSASNYPLR